MALLYVAEILAQCKTDDTAADGTGSLRIGIAEVAVFSVGWRLIALRLTIRLRLLGQHMRNAVRQSADLREQKDNDHQKPDGQAVTHRYY